MRLGRMDLRLTIAAYEGRRNFAACIAEGSLASRTRSWEWEIWKWEQLTRSCQKAFTTLRSVRRAKCWQWAPPLSYMSLKLLLVFTPENVHRPLKYGNLYSVVSQPTQPISLHLKTFFLLIVTCLVVTIACAWGFNPIPLQITRVQCFY